MERQIFINEMQARFNLRKPRSEKPTNLYLVCRINNKQVKLSTGGYAFKNYCVQIYGFYSKCANCAPEYLMRGAN